jgi:CarD family transcriptional regulator
MAMYKAGDYVICRSGGVWRVAVEGDQLRLIEHESGAVHVLPKDSVEIVRKIASKETILGVIKRITFIRTFQAHDDETLTRLYEEAMSKYDEIAWIKVVRTVHLRRKKVRSLMPSELAYMERAEGYFHGEISILLDMPVSDVEDYIFYVLSKYKRGGSSLPCIDSKETLV